MNSVAHLLNTLAPVYLELCCYHLTAYDLCRLWFCGDSTLNSRLVIPGVVKAFRLSYTNFLHRKWPRFLSLFPSLEVVIIRLNPPCGGVSLTDIDITLIPKTARKIILDFPRSGAALFDLILDPATNKTTLRAKNLTMLWPKLEELMTGNRTTFYSQQEGGSLRHQELWSTSDGSPSLPHLKSLIMGTEAACYPESFGFLPKSLTHLELVVSQSFTNWVQPLLDMDKYLSALALDSNQTHAPGDANKPLISFPPSLTSYSYSGGHTKALGLLRYLPLSVVHMNLDPYYTIPDEQLVHLRRLPLLSLKCHFSKTTISTMEMLPPTLQKLKYRGGPIVAEALFHLPRSLVSFSSGLVSIEPPVVAPGANWEYNERVIQYLQQLTASLPTSLTKLKAILPGGAAATIPFLPACLDTFKWRESYSLRPPLQNCQEEMFEQLPAMLRELHFLLPTNAPPLTSNWARYLPNVQLRKIESFWESLPEGSIKVIGERQAANPHFQSLNLAQATPDCSEISFLPVSLTELVVTSLIDLRSIDWTGLKNLRTLACAVSQTSFPNASGSTIGYLPRSLTDLKLLSEPLNAKITTKARRIRFTTSDASQLPPYLTALHISLIEELTDKTLMALPTHLVGIHLHCKTSSVTEFGLMRLPSSVIAASFTNVPSRSLLNNLLAQRPYLEYSDSGKLYPQPFLPSSQYSNALFGLPLGKT